MGDEIENADAADSLDDSGGVSDAELIGILGLGADLTGGGEGDDDAADDGESDADADGENDGDDEGDDADDDDAGDSGEKDDDAGSEEDDESDEDKDDDDEPEEEEEEKLPKSVVALQKRVNTLTKRAKGAEAEVEVLREESAALNAKLEKAAPTILQPGPGNPLSDLMTVEAVEDRLAVMKSAKRWCLDNLEGGTVKNAQGEDVELDAKAVRQRLAYVEDVLTEHGPARVEYLRAQETFERENRKSFPALYKDGSEDHRVMSSFLRVCPEIMRLPNYRTIIGDAIRGMRERLKEAGSGKAEAGSGKGDGKRTLEKKAAVKRDPAPRAIAPAPAKSTTSGKAKASRAERSFMASGSKGDLEAMVLSSL